MEKIPPTPQSTEEIPEHEGGMSMPPPVMSFDTPATPPTTKQPPATPPATPPSSGTTTTTTAPSTSTTTAAPTTSGPTTTTTTAPPAALNPGSIQVLRDLVHMPPPGPGPFVARDYEQFKIMQTAEWRTLTDPAQQWRQTYRLSYEQALETCYRILGAILATPPLAGTGAVNVTPYVPVSIRTSSLEEADSVGRGTAALGSHATLVSNFRTAANAATTVAAIAGHVSTYAHQLWTDERRASRARTTDPQLANSDAAIYTARNVMRDILRQHSVLRQDANLAELQRLIQCLEDESRGRADVSFNNAPATAKRILITGFDPFGANVTSNPSGIVAANLDGQTLSVGTNAVAYLEALSFPVRYDDFDQGMVERIVGPIINDPANKISMVITISLAGGTTHLVTDRFAAHTRYGWGDNGGIENTMDFPPIFNQYGVVDMTQVRAANTAQLRTDLANETYRFLLQHYGNLGTIPAVPNVATEAALLAYLNGSLRPFLATVVRNHFQLQGVTGPEFIESNMDLDAMVANRPTHMGVDQGFQSFDGNGVHRERTANGQAGPLPPRTPDPPATTAAEVNGAQSPISADAAREGSGGDYLSNEIYYRVSALRTAHSGNLKNVHIHIPNPTDRPAPGNPQFGMSTIISQVRDIITVAAQHN